MALSTVGVSGDSFRGSSERRIVQTKGVELIMGEASFTAPKQIEIRVNGGGTRQLKADLIFINSGARPSAPNA